MTLRTLCFGIFTDCVTAYTPRRAAIFVQASWMSANFQYGVYRTRKDYFQVSKFKGLFYKVKTEQNMKLGVGKVETSTSLIKDWRSKLKNKGKGEMIE